jgi:hypothetical protein
VRRLARGQEAEVVEAEFFARFDRGA